jgi:pilus assembly protein Flp/PilA
MMKRFLTNEDGATAIEYALIAGLIFMAIVAAIIPVGEALNGIFTSAAAGFEEPST